MRSLDELTRVILLKKISDIAWNPVSLQVILVYEAFIQEAMLWSNILHMHDAPFREEYRDVYITCELYIVGVKIIGAICETS